MKSILIVPVFIFQLAGIVYAQSVTVVKKATLATTIHESSGLLNCSGRIITHNDSGGNPELYEVDSTTGAVIRTVVISNAKNIDWEDLAQDDLYIYIGDFGNNNGTRVDLKIYRILKDDYLNSTGTVEADSILFNYADQTSFTSTSSTNFDAEAMIIRNDSVYIFTKNWGNFKTNIYSLPKTPGTYQSTKIDSLNIGGLVTGATYNHSNDTILLIGYFTSPFIWKISQFNTGPLSAATNEKFVLPLAYNVQTEGICKNNSDGYFVTSETYGSATASLFLLNFPNMVSGLRDNQIKKIYNLYPNPACNILNIETDKDINIEIMDGQGKLIFTSTINSFDISHLTSGLYLVKIKDQGGIIIGMESLIIK
jgi:hypothetical protein